MVSHAGHGVIDSAFQYVTLRNFTACPGYVMKKF